MNLNEDVVYRGLWLRPLHQFHPGRSRGLVRHHYRLHGDPAPTLAEELGDRGYDSDALDRQLMTFYGIEMIAAHAQAFMRCPLLECRFDVPADVLEAIMGTTR